MLARARSLASSPLFVSRLAASRLAASRLVASRLVASLLVASLAACQLGCSSEPKISGQPDAARTGGDAATAEARQAAPGSSATSPPASASSSPSASSAPRDPAAELPKLPKGVTLCEATGHHYGDYTPTVADIQSALEALPVEPCLTKAIASDAVAACAAKLGKTAMTISTDALGGTKRGCQVTIAGATSGGRKWIVLDELQRDGATFFGGSNVVELLDPRPVHYLAAFGGKHAELCPTTATSGAPVKPADLPSGWKGLPEAVKLFLCSGAD
jgi:hypothetical protein